MADATLTDNHGRVIGHGVGVHQTALYDMLLTMALLLVLVYLNRRERRTGILFFTYAAWYGTERSRVRSPPPSTSRAIILRMRCWPPTILRPRTS